MTFADLLSEGQKNLEKAGIADARTDAWYLLSFVTGLNRAKYLLYSREQADALSALMPEADCAGIDWIDCYRSLIQKRATHVPLQHLTGSQEFMGFLFAVSPDVLIPRQDTEILVEEVLEALRKAERGSDPWGRKNRDTSDAANGERVEILDLCTGSGCIAISVSLLWEKAAVTASDLSEEALAVAMRNAGTLGADVRFVKSDLFKNLKDTYDIIVSNPPYIPTCDIGTLMPEVGAHEPRTALDGGPDGLDFYRRIATEAPAHLKNGGRLFLEIGCDQAQAVQKLLRDAGFTDIRCRQDLAGLDRVVSGILTDE